MEKLNFPSYKYTVKNKENKNYIFDRVRKKWLFCTPEEWVRVHCVHYLIETKKYPESIIRIEQEVKVFNTKKRFDILVSDKNFEPYILVECKAPSVKINQKTFDQIVRYNLGLKCPYLMVSNGLSHYFCNMNHKKNKLSFIKTLPEYKI
tara:strand:- start:150 stop:596 length:447 start_codon:yes stop_codon:yes gene_type:complete